MDPGPEEDHSSSLSDSQTWSNEFAILTNARADLRDCIDLPDGRLAFRKGGPPPRAHRRRKLALTRQKLRNQVNPACLLGTNSAGRSRAKAVEKKVKQYAFKFQTRMNLIDVL